MPTREWIENAYCVKGRSTRDIGRELSVDHHVVRRWLVYYGITPRKRHVDKPPETLRGIPAEEWINNAYWNEWKTLREIGEELSLPDYTIESWFKALGIPRRTQKESHLPKGFQVPDKEWFTKVYLEENITIGEIAELLGCSDRPVRKWIVNHGIPLRSRSEAIARTHEDQLKAFWSRVEKSSDTDGCWIWTGIRTDQGYGRFWGNKVLGDSPQITAHKFLWFNILGNSLDIGKDLHHSCLNRLCCNPSHIVALTKSEHGKFHARRTVKGNNTARRPQELRKAKRAVKKRDQGLCRLCDSKGISSKGCIVHHIATLVDAPLLSFDPGNLILLCAPCHNKVTGCESRWKRKLFTLIDQPLLTETSQERQMSVV